MVGPVGYDDFDGFTHAFLIRDPARMIASYLRKREAAAFEDFGLDRQAEFFEREADRLGRRRRWSTPMTCSTDPEGVLAKLCAALGIALDPAMLSWAPGRRATDGPWAPHWYGAVEASTGFGPPETGPVDLPDDARASRRALPAFLRAAGNSSHQAAGGMMDAFSYLSVLLSIILDWPSPRSCKAIARCFWPEEEFTAIPHRSSGAALCSSLPRRHGGRASTLTRAATGTLPTSPRSCCKWDCSTCFRH